MKRILIILSILSLLLIGCGREVLELPQSPTPDNINSTLNVQGTPFVPTVSSATITDNNATESGIQGLIYIYFDYDMSNPQNFITIEPDSDVTIEDLTMEYLPEMKAVKITGTFPDNRTYLVTISGDLTSSAGTPIDGNGNGIGDGSPYDDVHFFLTTGTGGNPTWDFWGPVLYSWNIGPLGNNVPINTNIYLGIDGTDLDTTTIKNAVKVYKYDEGEWVEVPECSVMVNNISSGWADNDVYIDVYDNSGDMYEKTIYRVEVDPDIITDTLGNKMTINWGDLAYVTEDRPSYVWEFMTTGSGDVTPPDVNNVTASYNDHYIRIRFDDEMDIETLTSQNIKVYNSENIEVHPSFLIEDNGQTVKLLMGNLPHDTYRIVISKNVTDDEGWMLDGNNDYVGGQEANPYRYPYKGSDDYETWVSY